MRSLAILEQQLGADHSHTATSLNNLAALYRATGCYAEAEPLYLRALEILFNRLGENHPNSQTVRRNFIDCLREAMSAGQDSQLSQHRTTQAMLKRVRETE
ncbi:tetratricopeptide repeat protein [Microcoleus sp. Pol14C2]|uniref:tetratricopeptide repeat protein n=1 Tax=unclassified Microcoleus TaxID=2642155 RepID=UPI002FD152BC